MNNRSINPILPNNYFIPDVEARVFNDGRVYLYGSFDDRGANYYCSKVYHVFSSDDLVNWVDHGVSFDSTKDVPWSDGELYAPDCVFKDGVYYLYFCMSDGTEGVATSVYPFGPFENATQIKEMEGIDPGVIVDDDNSAYIYWGQFNKVRCAKLNEDMKSIDKSTVVQPLTVEDYNFHEGSCIRKRNGIYYLIFAETARHGGKATTLAYAMSHSPLGPFEYKGVIIDNYGSDKNVWNNHGSILSINDQWYVFYHRSSRGTKYSRRVCVEKIFFNEVGTINEVEMTSLGFGDTIDCKIEINAYIASKLNGEICSNDDKNGNEVLGNISHGDYAEYKYLNFEKVNNFYIELSSENIGGTIEVIQDLHDGNVIGTIDIPDTNGLDNYITVSCILNKVMTGKHALYLKFRGDSNNICCVKSFRFS